MSLNNRPIKTKGVLDQPTFEDYLKKREYELILDALKNKNMEAARRDIFFTRLIADCIKNYNYEILSKLQELDPNNFDNKINNLNSMEQKKVKQLLLLQQQGATVKCCVRDQFIRRQFLHSLNHFYLLHVCHSQI